MSKIESDNEWGSMGMVTSKSSVPSVKSETSEHLRTNCSYSRTTPLLFEVS